MPQRSSAMYTRDFFITATMFGLFLVSACSEGIVNSEECTDRPAVSIDGIDEAVFGRLVTFPTSQNPRVQFFPTDQNSTLEQGAKAIQINMAYSETSTKTSWLQRLEFPVISSAHASCAPRTLSSNSDLSNIELVSNIQYDESRLAGSDLSELFTIIPIAYPNIADTDFGVSISEFVDATEIAPLSFYLKFEGISNPLVEQTLTVSVTVDNGQRMYIAEVLVF